MGKVRNLTATSLAATAIGVGVPAGLKKNTRILGYNVASVGGAFTSDTEINIIPGDGAVGDELISSGDFTPTLGTVKYTSDFSADADDWVELTDGDITFAGNQTVDSVTECLKLTADAGGDPISMQRAGTVTNATMYQVTFDYYAEAGGNISFWALGANGDVWDLGYDHDSGHHPAVVEGAWTSVTLYGLSDTTALEIVGVTAANGSTEDTIAGTKYVAFKNIVATPVSNDGDWTRSADADVTWDMYSGEIDADASGAATVTYAGTNKTLVVGAYYRCSVTISNYVAGDLWVSAGGVTLPDMDADGTYTFDFIATATTALVLNADASGDGDFDSVSLKRIGEVAESNAIYTTTIQADQVGSIFYEFPEPLWMGNSGWWFAIDAGTYALDVNVIYDIM